MNSSKTITETSVEHDNGMSYRIPCPIADCDYVLNVCLSSADPAAVRHRRVAFKQQNLRLLHPNHRDR